MKGKNNDFSMTFYYKGVRRLYLKYAHNTERSLVWVDQKGIIWDSCVIYDRRKGQIVQVLERFDEYSQFALTFIYQDNGSRERVLHLSKVSSIQNGINWAFTRGFVFSYVNVYNRFTKNFIERIYI